MSTSAPTPDPASDPKQQAQRLRAALAEKGTAVGHGQALDLVARLHGHRDWNTMAAAPPAPTTPAPTRGAIPLLRIFDTRKALEFYVDFLGFAVVFEHRFQDHAPLYAEVVRDGVRLHLTEHHGDASPGAAVIVEVADARALQRELTEKDYDYARPGVEQEEWGLTVTVLDPFQNRLMFLQRSAEGVGRVDDHGAPIEVRLHLDVPPERAFEAFTAELGAWWPSAYAPTGLTGAVLEPRVGGEVVLLLGEERLPVGRVTSTEPGRRIVLDFWLAMDPDHPSELDVRFDPAADGTEVQFRHGGWTAGNVSERARFDEWPLVLGHYLEHLRRP